MEITKVYSILLFYWDVQYDEILAIVVIQCLSSTNITLVIETDLCF